MHSIQTGTGAVISAGIPFIEDEAEMSVTDHLIVALILKMRRALGLYSNPSTPS
jgi:hypothetical protein